MITLAALFRDKAILQRDQPVAVRGWGPPNSRVRLQLGPHTAIGFTSARGGFLVWLPPLPAGGPHTLVATSPDHPGIPAATASDLLVGEVWLASGQSNMEWTLGQCGELGAIAITAADDPQIRFFTVARQAHLGPQDDVIGTWRVSTPVTAPGFSAVAYHHAARLRRELGIPIGVIVSAWGGTPIEAWLSRQAHSRSPHLAVTTADYERYAHSDARWSRMGTDEDGTLVSIRPADPGITPAAAAWASPEFDDSAWPAMPLPSTWQRHGHAHSGVFWFRRTIPLPAPWRGRELVLELGAADKQDITFANGVEIGRTGSGLEDRHWNRPRRYTVPAALTANTDRLVLAVRVYSFVYDGGLVGPASAMRLSCPEQPGAPQVSLAGEWCYAVEHDLGHVPGDHDPGHLTPQSPHILHDNMIAPLAPCAVRGVLWYQGERNAAHADRYADLLKDLIDDWRRLWGRGDFPFLLVQLPSHGVPCAHDPDSAWARLREAQLRVAREVSNVRIVITLDVGEADDIHPKDKAPVGDRLAQAALVGIHGFPGTVTGPLPVVAKRCREGVHVRFDLDGSGIATSDGLRPATVFLRDAAGMWHPATACLTGSELVASSDACDEPVEIAYAWADNPVGANLTNSDGHPASPFRLTINLRTPLS